MKVINYSERDSVVSQFMAELRDTTVQNDRMRFRHNIERIGMLMAYDISKMLDYKRQAIVTPLTSTDVRVLRDNIVLGTVFRAGLPFHTGFLNIFDKAGNAFVSAYRYYLDKECTKVGVKIEYIASPALDGKTLIIVDPMLATGDSMELAYQALKTKGSPSKLFLACVIASKYGVERLQKVFASDDITLFCGAIDPILNDQKYIVPGLGDAGDLMYGDKL